MFVSIRKHQLVLYRLRFTITIPDPIPIPPYYSVVHHIVQYQLVQQTQIQTLVHVFKCQTWQPPKIQAGGQNRCTYINYMYIHAFTYAYTHVYIYICMYICVYIIRHIIYVCVCLYNYRCHTCACHTNMCLCHLMIIKKKTEKGEGEFQMISTKQINKYP